MKSAGTLVTIMIVNGVKHFKPNMTWREQHKKRRS